MSRFWCGMALDWGPTIPSVIEPKDDKDVLRSSVIWIVLTRLGERCFTGDTKISLLDGTEEPIQALVGRPSFWVYSYDTNTQKVVAGKAIAVKTHENAELVVVTLDNNERIRCTPNHCFMLRDGTFKEAKMLRTGDSLMPLYKRIATEKQGLEGYEMVFNPLIEDLKSAKPAGKWAFSHRIFSGQQGPNQTIVHHKNYNQLDNRPENLQWCTAKDHNLLHQEKARAQFARFEETEMEFTKLNWDLWKTQSDRLCLSWEKASRVILQTVNHKVVSVRRCVHHEPVYDLTVEKYHNFALSAGVFVHNCMLPEFGTNLAGAVGEPNDEMLANQLRTEVKRAVERWDDRVDFVDFKVESRDNTMRCTLSYKENVDKIHDSYQVIQFEITPDILNMRSA